MKPQPILLILFSKHVTRYIMGMHKATELRPYLVRCHKTEEIIELIASHINSVQKHEAA